MSAMHATVKPRVIVLLATYNGEKFLRPQLDSILTQTYPDFQVLCRDDQSTDSSAQVLTAYAESWPQKIRVLPGPDRNLGVLGSFSLLMQTVVDEGLLEAEGSVYIALADQDDIWYPEKLQRCVDVMQKLETEKPNVPLAVHSDLRVVTETGETISESFIRYQGIDPGRNHFSAQLLSNTVTGCAALLNTALLKKALPIPAQAIMHDWWLSLVASAFGQVQVIEAVLLDYRQHDNNTLGAREYQPPTINREIFQRLFDDRNEEMFLATARQSRVFQQRFGKELNVSQRLPLLLTNLLAIKNSLLQKCIFRILRCL